MQSRNSIKTFILTAGETYHRFMLAFRTTLKLAPMRTILILACSLGLLAAASEPSSQHKPFDCGTNTEHASEDFLKTIQALHDKTESGSLAARAALAARDAAATDPINIDAVFHIVATSTAKSSIKNDMPSSQLGALNTAYKPYNIQFNLINVTWATNDTWAIGANTADDLAMKQSLRQGSYNTLNLYFQTDLGGGVLGRCTLPSSIANGKSDPAVYANDGCNINAHTMPAGTLTGYNSGMTAVHETGHWMGLLHTFEGYSCTGPGDYIDDTPQESTATDGCPVNPNKVSCPGNGDAGDPIHNYMDYSVDSCYEGFTANQVSRMRSMWAMYRQGN